MNGMRLGRFWCWLWGHDGRQFFMSSYQAGPDVMMLVPNGFYCTRCAGGW